MSLNTEIEIKRWKPSKNDERKRCGPNLYVKGRLNGTKKFQMRFGNDPWIDVGYYPDTSLAQAREITITAKRIHKDRLASHDQINEAVGRLLELGLLKTASGGRLFVNNTA